MAPKRKQQKGWSIHPELHDQVWRLLQEDNISFRFYHGDESEACEKEYDSNIKATFICRNVACSSSGWASGKVAITIRMYHGAKYNARVYHQRCIRCKRLSKPKLDETYAERVAYRLKKWSGVELEPPPYSGGNTGPHQSELCEGCRNGHCTAANSGLEASLSNLHL